MAKKVTVNSKGLVKVNGIPVAQKSRKNGETYLYFKRKNNCRQRTECGDGETISLRDFVMGITEND